MLVSFDTLPSMLPLAESGGFHRFSVDYLLVYTPMQAMQVKI